VLSRGLFSSGSQLPVPSRGGIAIDPDWYFYLKLWAVVYSLTGEAELFSRSWADATRVYCEGCGDAFTPGDGAEPVSFTDPLSAKTYAAVEYGDGRFSPGVELVRQGQVLLEAYEAALGTADESLWLNEIQQHVELLDTIRRIYGILELEL
jgi:hypothetical protein